jgi:chromosome partitioning protein
MATVLSCVNLKGGVGKTALAVNLAAIAGEEHDLKTLLIDLDPQTNATFSCVAVEVWEAWNASNGTVADLLGVRNHVSADGTEKKPEDVVITGVFPNVDLLPSHLDLFTIDLDLGGRTRRESILGRKLDGYIDQYDLVVCDCPPNLTLPTQNALSLSSYFVVPVTLDYLSAIGIGLLINRIEEFGHDVDKSLANAGIVISRVGRPATHREETEETIRDTFGDLVLNATITERAAVSEAASLQKPVHKMGNNQAMTEFRTVAAELLSRTDLGAYTNPFG